VSDACQAKDLRGRVETSGVGAGSEYLTVVVTNRGGAGCGLEGAPGARLLDAKGSPQADPSPLPPAPGDVQPVLLAPGEEASTIVRLATAQCLPSGASLSVELDLPDAGGKLVVRQAAPPAPPPQPGCLHGTIDSTPFQPYPPRPPTAPPASRLAAALFGAPPAAARGQTIRFTVRLTDVASAPVELGPPCPGYTVGLKPLTPKDTDLEHFVLDCGSAGTLQPGQSASFEIEYQVPAGATTGSRTLVWSLDGYPATAAAQLTVT
jgi:uncharacterized protein DUF4232